MSVVVCGVTWPTKLLGSNVAGGVAAGCWAPKSHDAEAPRNTTDARTVSRRMIGSLMVAFMACLFDHV
jgi:hypothetical protein